MGFAGCILSIGGQELKEALQNTVTEARNPGASHPYEASAQAIAACVQAGQVGHPLARPGLGPPLAWPGAHVDELAKSVGPNGSGL